MIPQILRARQNGIVIPVRAYRAARKAGIPYPVACAFLVQESAGGQNVFGHDPMKSQRAYNLLAGKPVTPELYLRYKRHRDEWGMQGVGPMQLTWWEFQDEADRNGGCYVPYPNMLVAFTILAGYRAAEGTWWDAARRYNGSGMAAEAYADTVIKRIREWTRLIGE